MASKIRTEADARATPRGGVPAAGDVPRFAPTGRLATVDEMVIFRIADSRIAQAWEVYDESGMWRQLGVAPPAV